MLKEKIIDAVIVALPTFLHESRAKEAAEDGKRIFIEKPMAGNGKSKGILASTRFVNRGFTSNLCRWGIRMVKLTKIDKVLGKILDS